MAQDHIERREGVYYVSGTRVTLDSIVYAFQEGGSPESIREDFEGLSLAHVYGAIAFYLDQQSDIDAYLARRRQHWSDMEAHGDPPSADLQSRLSQARAKATP